MVETIFVPLKLITDWGKFDTGIWNRFTWAVGRAWHLGSRRIKVIQKTVTDIFIFSLMITIIFLSLMAL